MTVRTPPQIGGVRLWFDQIKDGFDFGDRQFLAVEVTLVVVALDIVKSAVQIQVGLLDVQSNGVLAQDASCGSYVCGADVLDVQPGRCP
mgnify:CR=1 FL=1